MVALKVYAFLALCVGCCFGSDSNSTRKNEDIKERLLFQGKDVYQEHVKQKSQAQKTTKTKEPSQSTENQSNEATFMIRSTGKE